MAGKKCTHGCGPALLALLALMAVAAPRPAAAHGYIFVPKARQVVANELRVGNVGGCPHCMQGGRAGANPDICGAPGQSGQDVTSLYFGPQGTLVAGQVFDFSLYINAQHGGRHGLSVCPLPRGQATQECFDRPEHQMVRADGSYADGKRYFYQPGSGWGGTTGNFVMRYRLPPGISCTDQANGCMIQWNWAAYQSGALRCEDPSWDVPQDCGKAGRTNNNTCDPNASWLQCIPRFAAEGETATENYRNCIDVIITPSNGTLPPNPPPLPPPSPPASPPPSPPPTSPPSCPPCNTTAGCAAPPFCNTTAGCGACAVPGEPSGCVKTRGRDRAMCLCRKFSLARGTRPYADVEFGCAFAFTCPSTLSYTDYLSCGSSDLFSRVTRTCQPAAGVACGPAWG